MDEVSFFRAAAEYASRGWRTARIHGHKGRDGCTCHHGNACGTPGKHPVDGAWQRVATTDEETLAEWFDEGAPWNIGVVLGEQSGIIDIEWDDDQGRSTAIKYGLTSIETPTYISHRSEHRLFKFDSRLPAQAVIKHEGLEIRIGGGSRGAQSVFPPSMHASGVRYRWKTGFAPDDVDVAPVPDNLMRAIVSGASTAIAKTPATDILHTGAGEGGRHIAMVRYAAREAIKMLDPHDPREQQDTLATVLAVNNQTCNPPLPRHEIEGIWQGQLRWAIKQRAAGGGPEHLKEALRHHDENGCTVEADETEVSPDTAYALSGLEWREGEWWPGKWRLKVVHSDPVQFVLYVPEGVSRTVAVTIDAETYMSANKVATAVLEATHTVILNGVPEEWNRIWGGSSAKPKAKQPAVRGLKAKLMDVATHEDATAEAMRCSVLAGWLLDVLGIMPEPAADDDDEGAGPDPGGRPTWVKNRATDSWELWYSWSRAWEDVERRGRRMEDGERLKMRRLILEHTGQKEFSVGRHKSDTGATRRYIRFTSKDLRALEEIASGWTPNRLYTHGDDWECDLVNSARKSGFVVNGEKTPEKQAKNATEFSTTNPGTLESGAL